MTSYSGLGGTKGVSQPTVHASSQTVELQLFESLIHHLIEKGVLTKNDALSVVQSVAEVTRGASEQDGSALAMANLGMLERLYSSFEQLSAGETAPRFVECDNLVQLRPPLHGDHPRFPRDN